MAHNAFSKTPSGIWALGEPLPPEILFDWERKMFSAINGDDGGLWAPVDPITISGSGVEIDDAFLIVAGGSAQIRVTAGAEIHVGSNVILREIGVVAHSTTLDATGATIAGDLDVAGGAIVGGAATIGGAATVTGVLQASGGATLTGDLQIANPAAVVFSAPITKTIVQTLVPYAPIINPHGGAYPASLGGVGMNVPPNPPTGLILSSTIWSGTDTERGIAWIPVERPLHGATLLAMDLVITQECDAVIPNAHFPPQYGPSIELVRQGISPSDAADAYLSVVNHDFDGPGMMAYPFHPAFAELTTALSHVVDAETGTYWIKLTDAQTKYAGGGAYTVRSFAVRFTYSVPNLGGLT